MTDSQLLADFVQTRSSEAFAVIVRRHVDLVYGTARRLIEDEHLAQDVAQAAFVVLAQKAKNVEPRRLPGWLVNATRLAAKKARRAKLCREKHEWRAAQMRSSIVPSADEPTLEELTPLLDEALSRLNETDRTAVVTRFLQGKSFAEVGAAMGSSEDAARKRVERAVEKLRAVFMKRGVVPSVGGLMVILAAHQAHAAPARLAESISAAAVSGGAGTSAILAKGVMKMMLWMKVKAAAVVIGAVLVAGGAMTVVAETSTTRPSTGATPAMAATSIPDAVQVLIAGWEDNLSRIRTISAKARLTIESDENEKCRDRDGNPCRMQTAQLALSRDGNKQRYESSFDKVFNGDHKVAYNYAFIDHLKPMEEPAEVTAARYGTPQTTLRQLSLADSTYKYYVERKTVDIKPADSEDPLDNASAWFVKGPNVFGRTLREYVVEVIKYGSNVKVEDGGNGQYVLVFTKKGTLPDQRVVESFTRVIIHGNKGYTIQRISSENTLNTVHADNTFEYEMIGGAWVLVGGDMRFIGTTGREESRSTLTVDRSSLKVNEPIDPAVFTVDNLHIAKGAVVYNSLKGNKYLYNDVSIEAKIEQARAQAQLAEPSGNLEPMTSTAPAAIPADARPAAHASAKAEPGAADSSSQTSGHGWIMLGGGLAAAVMVAAVAIRRCQRARMSD